ncbi:hypothetical protein B1222_22300 [Paenibacillus larvae subsp. pulvifaciens]|nr:hypothetical protein B1222_22300 [Paenibacillus larvae subsp. pulvifaciens]
MYILTVKNKRMGKAFAHRLAASAGISAEAFLYFVLLLSQNLILLFLVMNKKDQFYHNKEKIL